MCHFVSRLLFLDRSPFFFLTRTHCVSAGLHLQPSLLCCCTCMSFRVVETRQNKSRMEWHYPQFLCKYKYFLYFSYPSPKEQIQVGSFAPYKTNKSQPPKWQVVQRQKIENWNWRPVLSTFIRLPLHKFIWVSCFGEGIRNGSRFKPVRVYPSAVIFD